MAVLKCRKCGKTAIGEAREGKAKACPFCGAPDGLQAAPAQPAVSAPAAPAEAIQPGRPSRQARSKPRPPAEVATPADTLPAGKDAPEGKGERTGESLPRRRTRRRRKKQEVETTNWVERLLFDIAPYLATLAFVILFWVVLAFVAWRKQGEGIELLLFGCGGLVFLVGAVWLYLGAAAVMGAPEVPEFTSRRLLGITAFLKLAFMMIYAFLYAVTSPSQAWKPALLTVLGVLIFASGFVLLRAAVATTGLP